MDFSTNPVLNREFYLQDTVVVAKEIIGQILLHETADGIIAGRIVESEAYINGDPANHAARGMTMRNRVMFGPPGHAYVYMIHTHWCLNAVTQPDGVAEAVLIRAVEPLEGIHLMIQSRRTDVFRNLCSGPGKLTKAFRIDRKHNGSDLVTGHLRIVEGQRIRNLVQTTRIGISQGVELPLRFYSAEHLKWVSKR
ncbi:MAG TPA: DNA-3-methyladenine glycosylase [Armatimonadota bacterium]|nr:DNA-3-methyladenine glycosylase [Armatimonadota bacterium]HOP79109.1 DNA-3-methyladenine glycosylase [Armatimonadota bacterium]